LQHLFCLFARETTPLVTYKLAEKNPVLTGWNELAEAVAKYSWV